MTTKLEKLKDEKYAALEASIAAFHAYDDASIGYIDAAYNQALKFIAARDLYYDISKAYKDEMEFRLKFESYEDYRDHQQHEETKDD